MSSIPALSAHGVAVLVLIVVALILFRSRRIPLESSSLFVLLMLAVGFELVPYQTPEGTLHALDFFSGFGHEALIAVCALMIAGQGLLRTGALEPIGRLLAQFWSAAPLISLLATLVVTAVLSAFMNNTPIVVLMLPILISVSLRTQKPASEMLLPMGLATLVGGMSTTIGTSTNLLVVSVAHDLGVPRIEMFDFAVPAAIAGGIAILYLWLLAPRMLPERAGHLRDTSPRVFQARLEVVEGSWGDGKPLREILDKVGGQMQVSRIQRGAGINLMPFPDALVRADDKLYVADTPENLKEYEQVLGVTLYSGDTPVDEEHPLTAKDQQIAEVVVVQGSPLVGSTLKDVRFIDQFNLAVLALHRVGERSKGMRQGVGREILRVGDVLLVQGSREQITKLKQQPEFLVLDATFELPHTKKAPVALAMLMGAVVLAAAGVIPIALSATCAVAGMIITRCLSWEDTARALNIPVIMIVVVSLALGNAMIRTEGAEFLAQSFLALTFGASPAIILSGLMALLAVLTNVVSNNAAAVIGTPIAVSVAQQMELPAEPFVIAVLFGANMSYATPMAYKTNLLVMNAGGYHFSDFMRIGIPLTLLMWISLSFILPIIYLKPI